MSQNFFRATFRGWWKHKTFSFLNVFGLAVGIACAGLIFLWAEDERSFDESQLKKDRIYSVQVNMNFDGTIYTMGSTPRLLAAALQTEVPGILNTARVYPEDKNALFRINPGGAGGVGDTEVKSVYAVGRYADSSLFSMLTLPFVAGDPKTAFKELYSLVPTEKTVAKFFGPGQSPASVLGRTLRVDNKQDYTVTGVLKDLPVNSSLQFEWLAPFGIDLLREGKLIWGSYGPLTFVELAPQADAAAVQKQVAAINRQIKNLSHRKDPSQTAQTFLFPMKDWRLRAQFENGKPTGGGRIDQVRLLSAIAWVILLIACINFMNLATARSQQHAREIGVRKVLGAMKAQLVFRFLLEAVCMATLAAILAVFLMALSLPAFNNLVEKQLTLGILQPTHLATHVAALVSIILICGLVAGSYPALHLSSFNPIRVLKGLTGGSGSDAWVRKALVVFQFSLSIVFIIATITIFRQIQYVKDRNLGFNKDRLVEIDMQHTMAGQFPQIRESLLQTGVVENAAMIDRSTIMGGNTDDRFDWAGKPANLQVSFAKRNVSAAFVATSGLHLLAGHDFAEGEDSSGNILVTESSARLIDKSDIRRVPGTILRLPANEEKTSFLSFTVIGIVNDFVFGDMNGTPGPVLFFRRPPGSWDENLVYVRIRKGPDAGKSLSKIEAVIQQANPAYPFKYVFVDDQFNAAFQTETQMGRMASVFAVLAVFISCLGLFGLAAYMAERRTREIGIRKVLGASVAGITGLLSRDFLRWVALSCLIAFPVAWWLAQNWLKNFEYRITLGAGIFLAAGALALLIAWVTIGFQAVRAALANPVDSLRNE